jgi:Cu(I)/Ag(I) efflux system membrane fusion protein
MSTASFKMLLIAVFAAAVGVVATLLLQARVKSVHTDRAAISTSAENGSDHSQKQLWTCGMHPQVLQDHPGICPICHMKLTPLKSDGDDSATQSTAGNEQKKVLYWWDPMLGPSSISDKPGKSAMGMDLVPVYESSMSAGPKVTIDPTVVQNMGVRTAQVVRGPLDVTIRAVGMLKVPEPGLHDVNLKINGWVDKLYADTEGMHVEKDQPLFALYSPDLQVVEEELIGAVKSLGGMDAGVGEAAKIEAQGLVESAKRKLRLWDVAEQDIEAIARADRPPRTVVFRSPVNGHVVEKMIVQGSSVQAGMKLMRIEDHSKLWLDAEVYQERSSVVVLGQDVEATIEGLPGKTFTGKVSFLYPHIDHVTRTLTVRTTLDNSKLELRPGMYATAKITARAVSDALLVPKEAVIDTGTRQLAFVADGDGHFDPRKVRTGLSGDGEKLQILQGLAPGEMVVTSGQFLMDVESRTTEAIQKLRKSSPQAMEQSKK